VLRRPGTAGDEPLDAVAVVSLEKESFPMGFSSAFEIPEMPS